MNVKKDTIFSRVRKNFSRWDRNGDGAIGHLEMAKNISDSTVLGRDAAALATIENHRCYEQVQDGLKSRPTFTIPKLEKLEQEARKSEGLTNFEFSFEHHCTRITGRSGNLFVGGLPNGNTLLQGLSSTCSFLAVVLPLSLSDPWSLKEMVVQKTDGFEVTFPGAPDAPERVSPITDTETALYGGTSDGEWLTVLEKAWVQRIEGERFPLRQQSRPYEFPNTWGSDAIRLLTGELATDTLLPKSYDGEAGTTPEILLPMAKALANDRSEVRFRARKFGDGNC